MSCATDPAAGRVALRIRDTGVGIAADKLDAVFEPFVQVDQGLTRTHHGTGLGLAISRDLARGMGGDLRVRSAEGRGSAFTVTLRRVTAADGSPVDRRAGDARRAEHERVEVACGGGSGRTGTALACLAVLDGVPASDAVRYVRAHYRGDAVETPFQKRYVKRFG